MGRLYCAECGSSLGHFVGRRAEVERLTGAFEDARGGAGRLVLLAGEPGIGKTRTAEELAAYARRSEAAVLWGRCYEGEGAPAYWPWVQIVRGWLQGGAAGDLSAVLGRGASEIAQLVTEVRERLPELPPPLTLEPEQARFRLFDGVATFLRNAAAPTPLVLILDDIHLADRPSLLLLQFVAAELARARLLVVATYRHTEIGRHHPLSDTLSELARHPHGQRIVLRGLDEADAVRLIELIAGARPAASLVSAVCRHTEGNPFFIGELVPLVLADPALRPDDPTAFGLAVPQGVREVIGRRLNRLSPECNRILGLAAVIGRQFDAAVLERLAELPLEGVAGLLEEAAAAHVVLELPHAVGRYGFSHALIRETLYEEIPSLRRVRLHRRVGETLEALHAARLDQHLSELAHHFAAAAPAGDAGKAVTYAARAAARAAEQLAFEDAAAHYRRALQTLDLTGDADEAQRADLLLALGEAETGAGETAAARATFLRAADIARRRRLPERLARAALGVGTGFQGFWGYGAGLVDELLVALLEEARAALGTDDGALRALVLGRLAVALYWAAAPERRAAIGGLGAEAVAVAERVGDPEILLLALVSHHWADWRPDNPDQRLEVASRIVGLADRIGNPEMKLLGHAFRLAAELEHGRIGQANAEIEAFSHLAGELRQPRYLWWATMFRAMRPLLAGRFAEAEALAQEALAIGERAQASDAAQSFGVYMFTIRRELGGLEEVAEATAALGDQHQTVPAWQCGAAVLLAEAGREAEARRLVERLTHDDLRDLPRDLTWLASLSVLAEAVSLLEDRARAPLLYDLLRPYADRYVVIGFGFICWGSVARYLGLLATTLGRWEEAARHFESARVANERIGARPALARTLHDHAAMLRAASDPRDRDRAATLLAEAHDVASRLGMARLVTAVERQQSPGALPKTAPPGKAVFRKEGEFWTLVWDGSVCRLKDARGLHYIATLLRHPGRDFHARDLATHGSGGPAFRDAGSAGPLLDPQARVQYRDRLADLREELAEAERFNDPGRAAHAQAEIEFLTRELSAAVGLGNRPREAGSAGERARLAVTKRIRGALDRIRAEHPALWSHLSGAIRTGQYCSYTPPPDATIDWAF
jgi:hypothetical protein